MEHKFKIGDTVVHASDVEHGENTFVLSPSPIRMTVIGVGEMNTGTTSEPVYLVSHFDASGRIARCYVVEAEIKMDLK
jgi:hypothetical protein